MRKAQQYAHADESPLGLLRMQRDQTSTSEARGIDQSRRRRDYICQHRPLIS
jgi:hypothetical protein